MNREAAVLGTPTYTVFKGEMGAVDKYLIDAGQMVRISENTDIKKIKIEKKSFHQRIAQKKDLVKQVTDLLLSAC